MNTLNHTERTSTPPGPLPQQPRRRGHAWIALLAAGLLSASMIGFATGHDPGNGHQSSGAHVGHSAPLDDAHLRQIVHYLFDRSSAAQQAQIADIAHAAKTDLLALEQQAQQTRERRIQLLLRDTLDRSALERIRVEEMQLTDQRSQRVDRLLIELAGILTPQQRAQLGAHVQDMAG